MSESTTKGLVKNKIENFEDYPTKQDIQVNDIIYFKEDSYKNNEEYNWLTDIFRKSSKKQNGERGTPDYVVIKKNSNTIVIIECKGNLKYHSKKENINNYEKEGYGTPNDTINYAIDGALWYAQFLKDRYDVVTIAVSGITELESRVTSFIYPKNGSIKDIKLLEDGTLENCLLPINEYEKNIESILGRTIFTEEEIKKELRKYTLACTNYLRRNGIEDNSKAGLISAIVLGLTNKESRLYKVIKKSFENKIIQDDIGKEATKMLKESLYGSGKDEDEEDYIKGIFDIDNIPKGKKNSLKRFYDILLSKEELKNVPNQSEKNKYFKYGKNLLSSCIYSLYENLILVLEKYNGIDVMGEFYTTFLRFTRGNAKEKGIVLTPKHITDLFCDIAEYYYGKKFDESTKILDTCCGTGGFLISALAKIKENIDELNISLEAKKEKYNIAKTHSLIGVERDSSMYSLAYANMRFHGDGKSNLFNCSSLLNDSFLALDDRGKTYIDDKKVTLVEALKMYKEIDIGMINPPYSLEKNSNEKSIEYPIVKNINETKEKLKKLKKNLSISKEERENGIKKLGEKLSELEDKYKKENWKEIIIQKGQDELDFISSMLYYLKENGIGIAIVPMSCAGNKGKKIREKILKHHTLLACMTMPNQLFFDSKVMVATCIMVFKAHIPHNEDKSVFFARWKNDGFVVIPHNGRKKTDEWEKIKKTWIEQIDGTAEKNDFIWLKKKIKIKDEALAEAYIKTDYSKLTDEIFERTLKKFALFKYMDENALLEDI
ncbi:HsdM family class I SAM-dependent methyltransferase [Fusobacterium polymorphum]|uniref:HsdM family class I SAM-dependent methyltransferase n=1 Tax=Fusobacterium nucleatum subsp. polymorphum TaxID=76857 RepID=UPI00300A200B